MRPFPFPPRGTTKLLLVPSVALSMALVASSPASSTCNVGAFGVCTSLPAGEQTVCQDALWGQIVPTDAGALPNDRDTTDYNGNVVTDHDYPVWQSVDAEEGYLLVAYYNGVELWDATGGNAADPVLLSHFDGRDDGAPRWPAKGEDDERVAMADAPEGDSDLLAVAVDKPAGLLLFDTSDKSNKVKPRLMYQDHSWMGVRSVYAATIGNTAYALAALDEGSSGIGVYDMSAARAANLDKCAETTNGVSSSGCPGVFKGRVLAGTVFGHIDGASTATGDRHFLAASAKSVDVRILDVTNPLSPSLIVKGLEKEFNLGVALWRKGSKYYLASLSGGSLRIYDVTNCLTSGCSALPTPRKTIQVRVDTEFLTQSESADGTPFLYVGSNDIGSGGAQREWLYDVSDPANPQDITPQGPVSVKDSSGNSVTLPDYWSWYYAGNPTGYCRVGPKRGQFQGNYFYRAAGTVLDVHELTTTDPTIQVDGPDTAFTGQAATFTASALSCTPSPSGWTWSADGGTGAGTSASADITWATPGPKTVSASNSACPGAVEVSADIQIEDASPNVESVSVSPNPAFQCQPVSFTANGVSGFPEPTLSWVVKDSNQVVVASGGDLNPFVWNTSAGTLEDDYTATVTASNTAGPDAVATSPVLDLNLVQDVPTSFTPSNEDFAAGTVQFHADADNATGWCWSFGDGNHFPAGCNTDPGKWSTDPVEGPNPVHSYQTIGTYDVTVQVENCVSGPVTSDPLEVLIEQIAPLDILEFQANNISCNSLGCFTEVGKSVSFAVDTTGNPTGWSVDWDDGSDSSGLGEPPSTISHTFTSPGDFAPTLTITRGAESKEKTHSNIDVSSGSTNPPSINVTGPTSGSVGESLTFFASASNCTPVPTGWSWSVSGGNVSGGQTGSSISVSWGSIGFKTVSATNSACGSATDSHTVQIGGDGGGDDPDQISASFTYSPASPAVGEEVTFDASASTGNVSYGWQFGDGSSGSGQIVTHKYEAGGPYQVELNVVESGCLSAGCPSDTETKTVVVSGGPAPLDASFETDAQCIEFVPGAPCEAEVGQEVGFTGTTEGADTHEWDFGDGGTRTGKNVTYAWSEPGDFTVTYTASNEESSDSDTRRFQVTGEPQPTVRNVVVPWISQSDADKALPQSSDLVVHNPGDSQMKVQVTFRKRGLPEPVPPTVELTIAPQATHHEADIVKDLFDRPNLSGFLFVEPLEGDAEPVVSSVNRTFQADGRVFGQVVPGFPVDVVPAATTGGPQVFHLVGLNANTDRLAYFGISNPSGQPLFYHLRFYDSLGELVGGSEEPEATARFGQKQYQSEELAERFGVEHLDDYRIEIEPVEGSPRPYVYGANLRLVSKDPSFLRAGRIDASEVFLLGVLSTPGLNDSLYQSDLVLGNTSSATTLCDLTFTPTGFQAEPTAPVSESLPGRESIRLEDVVSQWDLGATVGVLRVACDNPSDVFPVVQGESYDVSRPEELYGQFMPALTLENAAREGGRQVLAGLQQDPENRTTIWLFNPGDEVSRYSVRYLDLQGNDLGGESDVPLGSGKFRQINPGHHPFVEPSGPITGPGGFVVVVEVARGRVLSAAQVVNAANDPAYIVGQ